ncbi:hypothetical protein [Rhodococcus ruber]|uniref:hypothetical protein n=1 Tax=Rhodococcus ruber TaxID=1830 RepID=UPI001B803668|nr:hypothetical protein [Rhodococcus ruber]
MSATSSVGVPRRDRDTSGATNGTELELWEPASGRTPYANLLPGMLHNDPTLFIRGDEAEEAWRIVDPVMKAWSAHAVPMQEYAAGTEPPGPSAPDGRPGHPRS